MTIKQTIETAMRGGELIKVTVFPHNTYYGYVTGLIQNQLTLTAISRDNYRLPLAQVTAIEFVLRKRG